jgi:hypothetical protein
MEKGGSIPFASQMHQPDHFVLSTLAVSSSAAVLSKELRRRAQLGRFLLADTAHLLGFSLPERWHGIGTIPDCNLSGC